MFEVEIKDFFQITGRGYVLGGEIINKGALLSNGDTLMSRDNKEQKIYVKSIEMVNFGAKPINLNLIGLLVDITEEEAKELVGKRLFKE